MIYLPVTNVWPFRLLVMFSFYKTEVKYFIYKHLEVDVQNQRVGIVYLCVCARVHTSTCIHVPTHTHVPTCVLLCCFSLCLRLESFHWLASLVGQWLLGIFLSLSPPQLWSYRCELPCLALTCVLGVQTQVLVLVQQTFYSLVPEHIFKVWWLLLFTMPIYCINLQS